MAKVVETFLATVETLLTLEEYSRLPETDRPTELVRGNVVETEMRPASDADGR